MSTQSGEPNAGSPQTTEWLLGCAGLRVDGPNGTVGHVIAPVYDFSARWDRPRALAVRSPRGVVELELAEIERVEVRERRIVARNVPR
jgi:hypothetical protein